MANCKVFRKDKKTQDGRTHRSQEGCVTWTSEEGVCGKPDCDSYLQIPPMEGASSLWSPKLDTGNFRRTDLDSMGGIIYHKDRDRMGFPGGN